MKYKRITDDLVEIEYDENKNEEALDCTEEIEELVKQGDLDAMCELAHIESLREMEQNKI